MAQDIILKASFLTPSTIYCKGARLTYGFKPLTRTTPLTNSYALAETQVAGFENPKIKIQGFIDTNKLASSNIQHTSLLALAKNQYNTNDSDTHVELEVLTGSSDSPLYATDGSTSSIRVAVESFNIKLGTDSDLAHFWAYDLNLVETL